MTTLQEKLEIVKKGLELNYSEKLEMLEELKSLQQEKKSKRVEQRMVTKCPFHNEKTGSCIVDLEDKTFYCLGCTAEGTIEFNLE